MAQLYGIIYSSVKWPQQTRFCGSNQMGIMIYSSQYLKTSRLKSSRKQLWCICEQMGKSNSSRGSSLLCRSMETQNTETKESVSHHTDFSERTIHTCHCLAEACKFVYNDAKYVNERARNDMIVLSRGMMRLNARARQDVAILGSGFLKLDARAREDTEKIDNDVKRRAEYLRQIAIADLRRANFIAKQRAVEDALMALEFIKEIHDRMVSKMYNLKNGSLSAYDVGGHVTLEKNGKALDFFPGEVSTDRISALQEAYWNIASALSEADGIDYTDPEELELLVATLIDLDAMDGKSSVLLLAECSNSPDVNTRKALANALSAAPSMWTLGNAGMGALQRLAEDSNPAVAAAATKTMNQLKRQWEIEEGDSWRFMVNQKPTGR